MRITTYAEMIEKPAPFKRATNFVADLFDGLYRVFAPRNKFGLTFRQTETALQIAKNGKAGIVLARLYACTGCGISAEAFGALMQENDLKISD